MSDRPNRKRTFELSNFNMAVDALQRASQIASAYDMSSEVEQVALRKAMDAEMELARRLMDLVEIKESAQLPKPR
jgi:hypothetical protein